MALFVGLYLLNRYINSNATNSSQSMGFVDDHETDTRSGQGEIVESSGFHLLEIHLPSVGLNWLFVCAIIFTAGILLLIRRLCKEKCYSASDVQALHTPYYISAPQHLAIAPEPERRRVSITSLPEPKVDPRAIP